MVVTQLCSAPPPGPAELHKEVMEDIRKQVASLENDKCGCSAPWVVHSPCFHAVNRTDDNTQASRPLTSAAASLAPRWLYEAPRHNSTVLS